MKDAVLNVVDAGGNGIPFVFQHGLGGDASQTAEVFPEKAGYRRITLECRGHGQSEAGPLAAVSLAQFSDDLGSFIETKFQVSTILGGISMGAAISLMLAVRRPELIKALVLARPAWLLDAAPQNMRPNAYVGELLSTASPVKALDAFNRSAIAKELEHTAPDNLASLRSFFKRASPKDFGALLTRISADGPGMTIADLSRLRIPVLVIGTDCDYIHPFRYAEALAEMIPRAMLVKVTSKSASRESYVREFKAALCNFLKHAAA